MHVVSDDDVCVVGSDSDRLFAAHYDGTSWQEVALPRLSGLSATANGNGEVWIGGTDGNQYSDSGTGARRAFVLRGDGAHWQTTYVPVPAPSGDETRDGMSVQALAVHDGTVWAGLYAQRNKDRGLARWNGSAWETAPAPGATPGSEVTALYPTANGTLWANGLYYPHAYLEGYAASLAPAA
ncbi:hypothetical protein ACH4NV_26165 [Streptomyces althioticus]|uniref:hypothetical protein n=1 Tax=Streptomyces althioticus group TaxID=2867194 RepID=UPI00351627CC|nr:hypothetical protein OHA53_27180 [Streptomyces althioticus]